MCSRFTYGRAIVDRSDYEDSSDKKEIAGKSQYVSAAAVSYQSCQFIRRSLTGITGSMAETSSAVR